MRLLIIITTIVSLGALIHPKEGIKFYPVKKVEYKPVMTGKGDDPKWQSAALLTDFQYPWEDGTPLPTSFRAIHDDEWVYFLFNVTDNAVHIEVGTNDKAQVAASSRAEIFFKRDDKMTPYYCLEIDPNGRVLDYEAFHHRKFDYKWSWPKGHLVVNTEKRQDGYVVEFAISKNSLRTLGLLANDTLQAGIYRADCIYPPDGKHQFKWISWVRPDSETPDFHIPSSFGILRLEP